MMRFTTIAALIALSVPAAALAEARPRAGSNDSRLTYATFQEGQVYTIHTRVRNVTLVELGDGETIRSIAIGDSEAFQVDKLEGSNVFTIKPVLDGASTNLTVETNRRFYFINVVESARVTPNWSVKFTVPGSGGTRSRAASAAAAIPATCVPCGSPPSSPGCSQSPLPHGPFSAQPTKFAPARVLLRRSSWPRSMTRAR